MTHASERDSTVGAPLDEHLYRELKSVAAAYLSKERRDHTLTPTDLVHEAYLRLGHAEESRSATPEAVRRRAAQVMRHVLVDHARRRATEKRDSKRCIAVDETIDHARARDRYVVAFDRALADLAALDDGLVAVVELLFFGGCTIDETARALQLSPRTVKRRWSLAKGWLHREITSRADR